MLTISIKKVDRKLTRSVKYSHRSIEKKKTRFNSNKPRKSRMYYRKKNEGVRAGFKIGVVSQLKR